MSLLSREETPPWAPDPDLDKRTMIAPTALTPEQLYDIVAKTYTNVAIVKMGDTWVLGRMTPISELAEDAKIRKLGGRFAIEVMAQSTSWDVLVSKVLGWKHGAPK